MNLQNQVIKGPYDFMKGSLSLYMTTRSGLVAIDIAVVEI